MHSSGMFVMWPKGKLGTAIFATARSPFELPGCAMVDLAGDGATKLPSKLSLYAEFATPLTKDC
jgi:hypothetical protein